VSWPAYDIVEFCRGRLNIRQDVEIVISECCLKQDNVMGWTYDIYDNEIEIEIDHNLSIQDKIITLCHEMVHAWQYSQYRKADELEAENLELKLYMEYEDVR